MFNVVLGASFVDYTPDIRYAQTIGIDELTGALAIIIALVALAAAIGIQVLGSGISEQSVRIIITIVGYGSIWAFFSVLSLNLIIAIEIYGTIIYLSISILYVVGVMRKIGEG